MISVSRDLRLREVLQRIVGYACDLVDARYGALGVAGPGGTLADVITHGVEATQQAAIGDLPTGRGLLGELLRHPRPLRLADVSQHPDAIGFPPNHPTMRSFLGVPLLIGDEVFGTLYVTEKRGGVGFTDEDQETLTSLATAAGIAVENARMYERSTQRERWLQASNEITTALLSEANPADELRLITERAKTVAGAPVAAIALPDPDHPDRLVFKVVQGPDKADERMAGTVVDVATTASGRVFSTGRPLLLDQYGDQAANWHDEYNGGATPRLRDLGSAAIVPLAAGDVTLGVLLLIKIRGEQPFAEPDLELLQNFAAHAALALQYAKARADQRRLAVFEDRDRIAKEVQDLVIRRLFDIGLGLQGVSRLVQPVLQGRIARLVDGLDEIIRDLRRSIFSLQEAAAPEPRLPGALRDEVRAMVGEATDALGFAPRVTIDDSLDSAVPERIRPDLLATLREALSNVARHAHAGEVTIELHADADMINLVVLDDGVGIPPVRERHSGLANLARRAERWGGTLTVVPRAAGGTRLTWTVPLDR
ncbi:MAG TPA: GAF domain-containing protein [Actinophytocola sp.]|uniref:sensor histidine kinase n=1 Tax=Actinophytocola sp. TaxID=1872138 RepID=UPI002DDCF3DA|nr:GAF domain-containing protein [Actinophytocola sp.]HEV2780000.1 GAF domain-containing protein [Actinophytocola sp.]